MIELVTLEQIRGYVGQTGDHDNPKLRLLVQAASRLVLAYLKLPDSAYLNSEGTLELDSDTQGYQEVPAEVQGAVLYLAGMLYRDPDGVEAEKWQPGYLPGPVMSMLYHLRKPTLA